MLYLSTLLQGHFIMIFTKPWVFDIIVAMIAWMGLKLLIIDTRIIKFIISRLVQVGVCGQPAQAAAGAAHAPRLQQQPGRRLRAWRRGGHRQQPRRDGRQLGRALDQRLLGPQHPGHEVTQVIPPPHGPHIQVSTHYLHIINATSTHYLHTIFTLSTHYFYSIYTLSTQYLHTIYTLSS